MLTMNWINVVLVYLIVYIKSENLSEPNICDLPEFRRCFLQSFSSILGVIQGNSTICRANVFESYVRCTNQYLDTCEDHLGSVTSVLVQPYINVLENIFFKACSQELESVDCEFEAAEECLLHFGQMLSHGQLGPICRQAEVTQQCLEEPLDSCSGIPRYFVALVTDEIKLTSDLVCHHGGCDLDVAGQCLHDVMETLDFPIAIIAQSPVVCGKIRNALACVTNHTLECEPGSVPDSMVQHYYQLYRLSTDNCGMVTDNLMFMNLPAELIGPVYLSILSKNPLTSKEQLCDIYKSTLMTAAHYGDVIMTYTDNLLAWQHSMEVTMELFSDLCHPQQTAGCGWLSSSTNGVAECDVSEAENCLDVALVSKMVVGASIQKETWENICRHTSNMVACASHFLDGCQDFDQVKSVNQSLQTVFRLVGAHCNLLGTNQQPDTCGEAQTVCDVMKAFEDCGGDQRSACSSAEEVFECFHRYTDGCSSVATATAQFYMEWLLHDCPLNKTLLSYDILNGVSTCSLQLGYNMYNTLQVSSDFVAMVCAADELYEACISIQSVPQIVQLYMQPLDDMVTLFRQSQCNNGTRDNTLLVNFEENDGCNWRYISSEVTQYMMMLSNLPLLSVVQQQHICRTQLDLASDLSQCSPQRQSIVQQAIMFLSEVHNFHCQKSYLQNQRSCDVNKIEQCVENFGTFLNFAPGSETACSKLQETYQCIYENLQDCDMTFESRLLSEVKAIQSMLGNLTCPLMSWCDNTGNESAVVEQMCASPVPCSLDWSSCVAYTGYAYCLNLTETKNCIKEKLSGCDPLQYIMAKYFMVQNIQNNALPCNFLPDDPPSVLQVHYSINQCQQVISMATDVTKSGLCTAIGQYVQCITSVDQSELPVLWRGILGRNALLWQKRWYLDCQLTDGEKFIVDHSFSDITLQGDTCESIQGQFCLRSLTDVSVSYVMLPLTERQDNLCQVFDQFFDCVQTQVAGCTNSLERAMLTNAQWLSEKLGSIGVCSADNHVTRDCDPAAAVICINELGTTLLTGSPEDKVVCSQLLTTSICVDERTSSCDYNTRNDVLGTFSLVSSIVQQKCSQEPAAESQGCLASGETMRCDLEEILTCMVPVRAKMLQPQTTSVAEVCGMIPAMKTCIQRHSSGCDVTTMTIVNRQLLRLNARLGNQCPQMYCEECKARQCLAHLYQSLQYAYDDLCVLIAETKQCIYDNAQYCERSVGELLLQEMALLVGEQGQACEVTLPACLRTLMLSAFKVVNYNTDYVTMTTNSSFNNLAFMSLCNEAATAYYCVSYHVTAMEGPRQWVMNETLQEIGALVSQTCQGLRLQCYSCVNATSNEECNSLPVQTCSPDMQSCGTVVSNGYLSKGCVRSDTCQTGCYGDTCTLCCQGDMCNQPWNDVITEPTSCQPRSALWCGFQLLNSLAQNDTVDCSTLEEAIQCMGSSTADCALHLSMSLGIHAHRLLASDVVGDCISQSSACACGQCTSLILLTLISNQYAQTEEFCRMAGELYNQTLIELSREECRMTTLQSTFFNINVAMYLTNGVCDITRKERECYYNGELYTSGSSFNATDGCNTCGCNNGNVYCTLMYCPPDTSDECPPIGADSVGICVEECGGDSDCSLGLICCSNGCGHTCQQRYTPGDADCHYGNTTYKSGDSFMDKDGCNTCFCSNGQVGCTLMYCPPEDSQCLYNGKTYSSGESFNSTDGCNTCFCYHGYIGCTEMACLPPVPQSCDYNNMTYNHGQSFPAIDGCNLCHCYNGTTGCTRMYCYEGDSLCYYGSELYQTGDVFAASDDCNMCVCASGYVGCTEIECPNKEVQCYYGNRIYLGGETFPALDGCNTCFCSSAGVGCTWRLCPPSVNTTDPPSCDLQGVHSCIEDAALPTLSALALMGNTEHICMSAKNMLRCIHTKIDTCPSNVLSLVREAVWWNLGYIQNYCDIQEIISSYNNETRPGNDTQGNNATVGQCSVNQAFTCFREISVSAPDVCSGVQSMIDCVEKLVSGCVSVARVPVLYELQHHLLPVRDVCNYTLSSAGQYDPLYPVSQCTMEFSDGIEAALEDIYFRRDSKTPVCDQLDNYLMCLNTAQQYVPAVGSLYINNIVSSLTAMIKECQALRQEAELHICHACDWSMSEEECDRQPAQRCLANQVCHTTVQQDISTGVAMVTKGCADITWCQSWYGCNPYTMTCVHCCYGEHCNLANNMTFILPPSQQTTAVTMTPRPTTARPPFVNQCDVSQVSSHMTILMVQITNFNFMPLNEKQLFCLNFNDKMAEALTTVGSRCGNVTRDRVLVMAEWLSNLRDDVCPDLDAEREAWERCTGSVRCLQGLGNFTDKSGACRSIKASTQCLHSYYPQCPRGAQGTINRTVELIGYMDDLICVNETLTGPEPQCVNVTSNKPSAVCNASAALECGMAVHRALYSPFTTREQYCRKMKIGMQCIQDNTFNCSTEMYQQVGVVVMEILHQSPDLCPDLWCPVDTHCKLDVANSCLDDIERGMLRFSSSGQISREFCLNLSLTHHCVWNATERCHNTDTRQVLQRYNQLLHFLSPYCQPYTVPTEFCLREFQSTLQYLHDFDQLFTLKLTYAVRDYISLNITQLGMLYGGLALPGVVTFASSGYLGSDPNMTFVSGIALPDVLQAILVGLGLPYVNLTGIGLPDVQNLLLQSLFNIVGNRNYGLGFSDIQFLLSGLNLPGVISAYDNSTNMNMTELLSMLMNQSYFGGNFQENLAEFGSHPNSTTNGGQNSTGTQQGYRTSDSRFSGYSGRKKRSLSPDQPDRAGNKTTFGPDRSRDTLGNGSSTNSSTNSYGNYSSNARPYLFNGTVYANASIILSMLNLTLMDLNRFLDQSIYSIYSYNKMAACSELQQTYTCLHDNLASHLQLVEPLRGFILENTLHGLMANSMEQCQDIQCHSCVGLDNEECNQQPVVTCDPLQVCQSHVSGDHISKGCSSAWSCDQECRQSNGPCYCCHGNLCNEPSHALNKACNVAEAMKCASSMLEHVMNHTRINKTHIVVKANCMMRATEGCYTTNQHNPHILGDKILQSLTCAEDTKPGACCPRPFTMSMNDSLLIMHGSTDVICRLFNSSLETYFAYEQNKSCYGNHSDDISGLHHDMIMLMNNHIHTLCPHNNTYRLYRNKQTCSAGTRTDAMDTKTDAKGTNVTMATSSNHNNKTDTNTTGKNCDMNFRDVFTGPVCSVAMAAEKCLMPDQNLTAFSNRSETEVMKSCIHQFTRDCVSVQLLPIVNKLDNAVSAELLGRDHLKPLSLCLYKYLNSSSKPANQSVIQNVCQVTDDVIGCLAIEKHNQLQMYVSIVKRIAGYLERLKEQVCSNENVISQCNNLSAAQINNDIVQTVTLYLAPVEEISRICRNLEMSHDSSLDPSSSNTSTDCAARHLAVQAWSERELDQLCSRQVVKDLCVQPTCDVTMATQMIYKTSHYFLAVHYSHPVFCRTLEHLMKSLKCYLHECNATDDIHTIKGELLYFRSVVHNWCPALEEMLYCDSGLQKYFRYDSDISRQAATVEPDTNTLTPATMIAPSTDLPATVPVPGNSPPRSPGNGPDRLRNREIRSSHDSPASTTVQPPESTSRPDEAGPQQCTVPVCSFTAALHCIDDLQGNSSSCGNTLEVISCIQEFTKGCSMYQKYAAETIFLSLASKLGVQRACLENKVGNIDLSYFLGYIGCVNGFLENIGEILDVRRGSQFGACDLLQSFLACVEDAAGSADVPTALQYHMNHLTSVTEASLTTVCHYTDDELTIEEGESCDLEQASFCLNSYSISVLMAPTFSVQDKLWICDHMNNGMDCLEKALAGCSKSSTSTVKTLHHLVKMLGQWSGICVPHQRDCSPHIALECMSKLEQVMNSRILYGNSYRICREIESANLCIKQTILKCDAETEQSFVEMFEPIRCKAYSLCPMAVVERALTMETPPSCISPGAANQEGACDPGRALYCILDFYGDYMDPEMNRDKVCYSYSQALECYFTNLQHCDSDIPVLLAHQYLHMIETVRNTCPTVISTSCDPEQRSAGCDLSQVEACIAEVELKLKKKEALRDEELCYDLETVESCVDLYTADCPRVTSLYARSLLMNLTSDKRLSDLECNTAESCGWSYVQRLITVLTHQMELLSEDGSPDMTVASDMRHEMEDLCEKRHSSLACVRNYTQNLPGDVAMLSEQTLHQMENLFAYACGDMFSMQTCVSCTSPGCLSCYTDSVEFYLPPLLSFLHRDRDNQNLTLCSQPLNNTYWYPFLTETCPEGQDASSWNVFYTQSIEDLYRKYCLVPCNQSSAEECLHSFQNQSVGMPSEEVCRLYDEIAICLNRSVSSCSDDVMTDYHQQAELIFASTGVICYVMPTLVVESVDMMYLEEGGSAQYINVTLTSVVRDGCHGNHCELELIVSSNNSLLPSCLNGVSSPQFITPSCSHIFSGETSQISIPLMATLDHKVDLHPVTEVKVVARLWEDGEPVAMETVAEIPVSLVDVDTSGVCTAQGVYMTTFDGFFYGNFYRGEFIIYQHTEHQYKVQVAIQKCKGAARCLCAVMVQVDDDVYILDRCVRVGERTHPLELYTYINGEITDSLHIYRSDYGNTFQFVLPTGTIITADSLEYELYVSIQPSPHDRNSTRGLCGVFDYNITDDLTQPDSTVVSVNDDRYIMLNLDVYRPKPFLKAWRTVDTLFEGVAATTQSRVEPSLSTTWCDCTNTSAHCVPQELVQTCDFVEGEEITSTITVAPYLRNSDKIGQVNATQPQRRRRRQASTSGVGGIDYGDGDDEDLSGLLFPTASGITEDTANTACISALVDSALGQMCSSIIDTTNLVTACVTDVLLLDSVQDAGATSVSTLQQQCQIAIIADPTLAANLNTSVIVLDILSLTCPDNCNGQGACVQGVCQCSSGYVGSDCSLSTSQAPVVTILSQDTYSATSSVATVTTSTTVLGGQFINSPSLVCHLETAELTDDGFNRTGMTQTTQATFLTAQSVSCPVTGSLPLTVLLLSVSNNGVNKSNEAKYIIQDPVCYDCDAIIEQCSLQPTSCVLDGGCYAAGAYNPLDQCFICDPFSNQWRYKASQSCPTTTTSSTTVSTQSSTATAMVTTDITSVSTPASTSSGSTGSISTTRKTPSSTVSTSSQSTSVTVSTESSSSATKSSAGSTHSGSTATDKSSVTPSGPSSSTTDSVSTASSSSASATTGPVSTTSNTTDSASSATPQSSTSSIGPTTQSTSSTAAATSSSVAPTNPSTPAPSSTPGEGSGEGQGSDTQSDRQTLTIVIIVAAVVGLLVITGIVVVSCRLRKQDACSMGHKLDSPAPTRRDSSLHRVREPELQGKCNPAFDNVIYDNYGQPVSVRLSAPFDPQGLGLEEGLVTNRGSEPPDDDDGLHRVNVHLFEQGPREGVGRGPRGDTGPGDAYYVQYDSDRSPHRDRPPREPVPDYNTRL